MARAKNAFEKNSVGLLIGAALLFSSGNVFAGLFSTEYEEDLIRADEPAMRDIVPMQTLNDIRDMMIKESIQQHGFCACPYSTDALGGQCGTLSFYYNEPWRKILCYRRDITGDMVHFYRLKHALDYYLAQENEREAEQEAKERAEKNKNKPKPDPTADYFRNGAKPIPKTIFSTGEPNATFAGPDNTNNPDYTTSGYYKNTSIPVSPVSNTTDLKVPALPVNVQ